MSRFFICYEYNELSQSTEEEMFQLVQRGIALTPAEKMRAMSTEWAKFARQYEEDYSMVMGRQYSYPSRSTQLIFKNSLQAKSWIWVPTDPNNVLNDTRGYGGQKKPYINSNFTSESTMSYSNA